MIFKSDQDKSALAVPDNFIGQRQSKKFELCN